MKSIQRIIVVAIAVLIVPVVADAQDRVDAMPADKYGFKPTNGTFKDVRTFADQVQHVACANFAFYNEIEQKTPPEGGETGGPSAQKNANC